jgi:chromosome segregation ATPase
VLAVVFGLWAQRLRQTRPKREEALEVPDRLEALESEADRLRQELDETQERLDFAERMLAQRPEKKAVGPQP